MAVIVAIIAVIAIAAIAFLLMNNRAVPSTATPGATVNLPDVNVQNPLPQGDGVPANGR